MLFELTEEEILIRDTARAMAAEIAAPLAPVLDRGEGREAFLKNLKTFAEAGFMAVNVREAFGGTAAGTVAFALAIEELGYACAATGVTASVTNMVAEVIQAVGNEEQKRAYIRRSPTAPSPPAPSA